MNAEEYGAALEVEYVDLANLPPPGGGRWRVIVPLVPGKLAKVRHGLGRAPRSWLFRLHPEAYEQGQYAILRAADDRHVWIGLANPAEGLTRDCEVTLWP